LARRGGADATRPLGRGLFIPVLTVLVFDVAERSFVSPVAFHGIVFTLLVIIAAENARKVFGIAKAFFDDRRGIGVMKDIFLEEFLVGQDVIDDRPEEGDIAAGPDADV